MKKFIATTIKKYLNENKIIPDYLKVDKPYIDNDGNIIGADIYKVNNYKKYNYIVKLFTIVFVSVVLTEIM